MSAGLESLATAFSGALSAVAAKVIIYPLDWMKLRLSVKRPDESATSILTSALKTHGIGGVYMVRQYLRLFVWPAYQRVRCIAWDHGQLVDQRVSALVAVALTEHQRPPFPACLCWRRV
eukprot:COSAG02_NODE_437_length_22340_cov_46.269952_10_plen_119_part_00